MKPETKSGQSRDQPGIRGVKPGISLYVKCQKKAKKLEKKTKLKLQKKLIFFTIFL